jgi:hypothetical protein
LERVCLFKRKQRGTIVVAVHFLPSFGVFAPVLRAAPLNESETIQRNGSREPFLFARQQLAIRAGQEKIMPA